MAGFKAAWLDPLALPLMPLPLAFTTAGDAANGLLFGWEIATVQKWTLIYLGLSSFLFVLVWVIGGFRRR
mgnify:FL=1|jgi:hypothetical protein